MVKQDRQDKPKRDVVTLQEERFVNRLLQGYSQADAYLYAFPQTKLKAGKSQALYDVASKVFNRPRVQKRFKELKAELREREVVKTGWTREQAIETLRFVIACNKKDMERINEAYEEEIKFLQELTQNAKDEKEVNDLIREMLRVRKKSRSTITNNNALISAVGELNKMQGFNEQNVNLNASVIFEGEEDLED